jgi:hypothetical protein
MSTEKQPSSLENKLTKFKIGDDVVIPAGMGDYDFGTVIGIEVRIMYKILDEYGHTRYYAAENLGKQNADS